MTQYLLGIDNGGTMAKAALFATDGTEVAVASCKSEMLDVKPGWAEFDMNAVWLNAAGAVKRVIEQSGVDPSAIACVACTGHGNGLYLVDEDANPVYNAIGSADGRAKEYVERWNEDGTQAAVRPKTMQTTFPSQPGALLRWLKDNDRETYDSARWVLMCKDFVRAKLTGEIYMELSDMSATSLMNVGTAEYEDDILAAWGIADAKEKLPPIRMAADRCGTVTAAAAAETGLAEGTPVAGGMFDIDACGLASGLDYEGGLCMVSGSWGNNQFVSKTPVADGVFITSCYVVPGFYYMFEGSPTGASNLEWFLTEFFAADREREEEKGKSVYDLCNELVAETKPEDTGIIFLPFLYGSNVSLDGKACFIGLDGWQKRGHVLRAIYEGVIFSHRWHMEKLLQHAEMPPVIRLTGGAANSSLWVQMFADNFQVPIELPKGTELGALGAAISAGVAAGVFDSYGDAIEAMVDIGDRVEPNPAMKGLYDKKYARYKQVLDIMDPHWSDLAWNG